MKIDRRDYDISQGAIERRMARQAYPNAERRFSNRRRTLQQAYLWRLSQSRSLL